EGLGIEADLPAGLEDVERIGRKSGQGVIGAVHDELDAGRKRAEAADHQPVADEIVVVADAALLERRGAFGIVIVAVVADDDVRPRDHGLEEDGVRLAPQWMKRFRARTVHRSFPGAGTKGTGQQDAKPAALSDPSGIPGRKAITPCRGNFGGSLFPRSSRSTGPHYLIM